MIIALLRLTQKSWVPDIVSKAMLPASLKIQIICIFLVPTDTHLMLAFILV